MFTFLCGKIQKIRHTTCGLASMLLFQVTCTLFCNANFLPLFKYLVVDLKSLVLGLFFTSSTHFFPIFSRSCASLSWIQAIMKDGWKTLTPSFSHVLSPSCWKLNAVLHLRLTSSAVNLTIFFSLLLFSMPLSPPTLPRRTPITISGFRSPRSRRSGGDS